MRKKPDYPPRGGVNNFGIISTSGGDVVGRDKIVRIPTDEVAIDGALRPLIEAIKAAPADKRAGAGARLEGLKQEAAKGSAADDSRIAKLLDGLVGLVPGAASAVVSAFGTPILAAITGPVTEFVLSKLRGSVVD